MTLPELSRRQMLMSMAGATSLAMIPRLVSAQTTRPHVVVVGGGFGGATAAKYLRHWSGGSVDVTLVETRPAHVSSILSNLVLNGRSTTRSLTFGYERLESRYGVRVVQGYVKKVDAAARSVVTTDGQTLRYDRLVLSPGIGFQKAPGHVFNKVPHAWKAGFQTDLLRRQLLAMPDDGVFVMTVPPVPYRCPPGPYERACVVADFIKRNKPGGRVVVLDANAQIVAERHTFSTAFEGIYGDVIDYRPGVNVDEVDSTGRRLFTSGGVFDADVLNVIPRHKAPALLQRTGLLNDPTRRWAGVDPLSYESTAEPFIHVIGDAQATGQPKAGHIANSEAKVCADAILRSFDGVAPDPEPVTNSACFSPITFDTASWLTAVFRYDQETGSMKVVPESSGEARRPSRDSYEKMFAWSENLFADTFG